MTFKDFFTLTELKDGFTAPSRVKELFAVIGEKDCVGTNISDITRQWSTVASTIAATENKDCLDLFVHLDGIQLINRWLQDSQKFGHETGDIVVEESIVELLRALEKLPVDRQKLVSSGIWVTVKNFVGHNCSRVQDGARMLFDSWKQVRDGDAALLQDVTEKVDPLCDGWLNVMATHVDDSGHSKCHSQSTSPLKGTCGAENNVEHTGDEMMPPLCSDNLQPERVGVQIRTSEETSDHVTMMDDGPQVPLCSSDMLKPVNENVTLEDDPLKNSSEGLNQHTDDAPQMPSAMDILSDSSPSEQKAEPSSGDVPNACESAETDSKEDIDGKGRDPCREVYPFGDARTEEKNEMADGESSNDCRTTNQNGECCSDVVQDFSCNKHNNLGDSGLVGEIKEQANEEVENDSDLSKPADIEPDYVVDQLEVARQVGNEVEREVTDCQQQSCSSAEKISDCGAGEPDSPDTTNGKQNRTSDGPRKEVPTGPNLSAEASSTGEEEPLTKLENLGGAEQGSCIHDTEFSSVTEAAQEPESTTEKGFCDFDLNQEISEDVDQQGKNLISTPISVVSVSRVAAAASGLPMAPLQFDGTLGWKGSAATSAFRLASPSRIAEVDKKICIDFDLNVAEGSDDDKIVESLPQKQIQMSSSFPSGESSVEASSRKSERLQWDLNRVSDGSELNGLRSPSPSSTSSSMQPALRNIDLNDNPSFYNDYSEHPYFSKSSHNLNASGGFRADGTAISIMGARVEVNRQNFVPQTLPLPNGRISMPAVDLNLAGAGGVLGLGSAASQDVHSPMYRYNGLVPGSAVYGLGGLIPYMGSSSSSAVVSASFTQTPYIMSMSGARPSSNGGVHSQNNFDLNSGLMIEEMNNDTRGGLRQFFSEGNNAQASSCTTGGVGSKRKEADGGWELYPVNLKHHQPPWI
ncbi:hypothetical protein LguiA_006863 [Lonicera macranthoides]